MPLRHDPGHAQVDFGETLAEIAGVEGKIHFFAMDRPHSDACFVQAYPAETAEAFCDGHNAAFAFFGDVPKSVLYDNTTLAVARVLGDGGRPANAGVQRAAIPLLVCRPVRPPRQGQRQGQSRGQSRGADRLDPPQPAGVGAAGGQLDGVERATARGLSAPARGRPCGHNETIGERLVRDLAAFHTLPPAPYDACEKKAGRVSSQLLVRYHGTDYSVPTAYGHREVLIRGYVHEVVICCGTEVIARHPRSYEREDFVLNPLHYLALLEQKIGARDQAAPLAGWDLPEEFATLRA